MIVLRGYWGHPSLYSQLLLTICLVGGFMTGLYWSAPQYLSDRIESLWFVMPLLLAAFSLFKVLGKEPIQVFSVALIQLLVSHLHAEHLQRGLWLRGTSVCVIQARGHLDWFEAYSSTGCKEKYAVERVTFPEPQPSWWRVVFPSCS